MPRGHHDPLCWVVVQCVMDLVSMRTVHLQDGRICPKEEVRERTHMEQVLKPLAVSAADAQGIAQAIARYGPECDSAQRMLKRRAVRMSNVIPFPADGDDPDDSGAALRAA